MQAFHSTLRSTAATSLIAIEFESFKDQKGQELFNEAQNWELCEFMFK